MEHDWRQISEDLRKCLEMRDNFIRSEGDRLHAAFLGANANGGDVWFEVAREARRIWSEYLDEIVGKL